jgi:opacity protein-like surface antigen
MRLALAFAALALAPPASAADLPTQQSLPSLAADPETQAPNWKGFYVGTELAVASFKGAKGAAGGDVFAGYDHTFDNNLVLGVRFSTGYDPWVFPSGPYRGFDFAETSVKLGYEMGRLTPYVVTGAALAWPTNFGGGLADPGATVNGLFAGPGALQAVGTVGAGVDYAVTNNLHVGLEAVVGNSPVGATPFGR